MRDFLSKELQRYYAREGNRIIFSNGMTLNQFAWEMWEKLGYKEVDPSLLSRVLKGERLFTKEQTLIFSQILELPQRNSVALLEALHRDLIERYGFGDDFFSREENGFLEVVEDSLKRVKDMKLKDINFVNDWIFGICEAIEEELPTTLNHEREALLKLYGNFLIEQAICLQIRNTRAEDWYRFISQMGKLEQIGYVLKKPSFVSIANYEIGNMWYIRGQYKTALEYLEKGIGTSYDSPGSGLTASIRSSAICYTYLQDRTGYESMKSKLLKLLPSRHIDLRVPILEAISRCELYWGNRKEAEKFMHLAQESQYLTESLGTSYSSVRRMQLFLTQLLRAGVINKISDRNELGKQGENLLTKVKTFGYKRLEAKTKELLPKIINGKHFTREEILSIKTGW